MSNGKLLVNLIKDIPTKPSIKKDTKEFIKDQFEMIRERATKAELIFIDDAITIMSMDCIRAPYKKKIADNSKKLMAIAIKYNSTPNKNKILIKNAAKVTSKPTGQNKLITLIEEVQAVKNVSDAEKLLDSKVPKYNKYDETHPMNGVTWSEPRQKYRVTYKNMNEYTKDLDDARNKVLALNETIMLNSGVQKFDNIIKEIIKDNQCVIIQYINNNISYFDVQHIILFLKLKTASGENKYTSIKDNKTGYIFDKNKHGGYIMRELITIDTVKALIRSSRSPLIINLAKMLGIDVLDCKILTKEQSYCNKIIKVFKIEKIICQKVVGKYRIDMYFPDYKLAIECDEHNHKDRDPAYEQTRQKYIEDTKKITFIRFNPDEKDFDILDVISKIYCYITNYR